MSAAAIRLRDIRFAWSGRSDFTLDLPALDIARGQTTLLLGASGGGKSTLLSLIAGISLPQQGRVEVLGQDLAALSPAARDRFRAQRMGVIFQMFNLLPYASALDNVRLPLAFGRKATQDEPARLLDALGIPAPLQDAQAARLSVGQQQRVAAARALIGAPELVIADEPTSALDEEARDIFLDLLFAQRRASDAALLMVSHDRALAPRFDATLRLEELIAEPVPC